MIIRTLTTFICKPLHLNRIYYYMPKNTIIPIYHQFSTVKYVPAIEKFQANPSPKNLNHFIVEMSGMNDVNRQKALDIVLIGVLQNIYPNNLLADPKFLVQLKKSPILYTEAFLYRIDESLTHLQKFVLEKNQNGKKVVVKDINESFIRVFQAVKKVPRAKAEILQIRVYKQFASYHLNHLYSLVDPLKKQEVLKKASQFHKEALQKLLKVVTQRLQHPQQSQPVEQQNTILISFNKFDLLQLGTEIFLQLLATHSVLSIQSQTKQRSRRQMLKRKQEHKQKPLQFKYHEGLYFLIPYVNNLIELYAKVEIQRFNLYFKLRKIQIQLNHHFNLSKLTKNDEKEKQMQNVGVRFQEMYKEIENIITKSQVKDVEQQSLIDLCTVLLSLRLQMVKNNKISYNVFEQMIITQIKTILSLISDVTFRKVTELKLISIVKEIYGVDLQQVFGKAPRSLRLKKIK